MGFEPIVSHLLRKEYHGASEMTRLWDVSLKFFFFKVNLGFIIA